MIIIYKILLTSEMTLAWFVKYDRITFKNNIKIKAITIFITRDTKIELCNCFIVSLNLLAPNKCPTTILHDLDKPWTGVNKNIWILIIITNATIANSGAKFFSWVIISRPDKVTTKESNEMGIALTKISRII